MKKNQENFGSLTSDSFFVVIEYSMTVFHYVNIIYNMQTFVASATEILPTIV